MCYKGNEVLIMRLFLTFITLLTFLVSDDDHEQPKFEGLLSSEVFALDG